MSNLTEFEPFPKIPRLRRNIVITEKIDGTNAQVVVRRMSNEEAMAPVLNPAEWQELDHDGNVYGVRAGSRNRFLTPTDDNFGFARWVQENASELVKLGEGRHFGEWWGSGIQRTYGLDHKRFSLFNVGRWDDNPDLPKCCNVVPVLYQGEWSQEMIDYNLNGLAGDGSIAAPGFMDPEGIVVFHAASRNLYKVTIKGDESPKGQ